MEFESVGVRGSSCRSRGGPPASSARRRAPAGTPLGEVGMCWQPPAADERADVTSRLVLSSFARHHRCYVTSVFERAWCRCGWGDRERPLVVGRCRETRLTSFPLLWWGLFGFLVWLDGQAPMLFLLTPDRNPWAWRRTPVLALRAQRSEKAAIQAAVPRFRCHPPRSTASILIWLVAN